jgi:hypothetical protein
MSEKFVASSRVIGGRRATSTGCHVNLGAAVMFAASDTTMSRTTRRPLGRGV